jgi:hypothetical protein
MLAMIVFPHLRDTGRPSFPSIPTALGRLGPMRATGCKPADGIGAPVGQAGEIIEGEQVALLVAIINSPNA